MKRTLLLSILGVFLISSLVFGYLKVFVYSFEGEQCGGFTPRPKQCLPGYSCVYPGHPTGIDTDFGTCRYTP